MTLNGPHWKRLSQARACAPFSSARFSVFNAVSVLSGVSPSGSFEFTYAEIGLGTTSVTGGVEMAFEDSWAHYCVHHFNQDGIIRG